MFKEITKDFLDNSEDRIFINDHVPCGNSANAHFLRYNHKEHQWHLEVKVEFATFKIFLQDWQAQLFINKDGVGKYFDLTITNFKDVN